MKNLYCWIKPPRPGFISALRLIELLDLVLKESENAVSRIAAFELVSERVREKILLCTLFVCFQGIIEDWFEVGG